MPAYFGLDLGSSSIKLLELKSDRVEAIGITVNPVGKVGVDLVPEEKAKLVEVVQGLVKESKVKSRSVAMSIPESQVFSRVMSLPVMSTPELASAIKWELDQVVPYPPDKIEVSWVVMNKPKRETGNEKMRVFVVAVPKNIADANVRFLSMAGLEPVRLENEVPVMVRSLLEYPETKGVTMLVDMGASTTKIVVADANEIYVNHVTPIAGMAITRMIAEKFKITVNQAEEYKRVYGVEKKQVEGKIFMAVSGLLDSLILEFKKVTANFENLYKDKRVERLMLVGGGAYLKGLMPFLVEKMGMEVVLGDPFSKIKVEEKMRGLGVVFGIGVGLAINE